MITDHTSQRVFVKFVMLYSKLPVKQYKENNRAKPLRTAKII